MASCVRNICTKNYQNLVIDFQVTVKNVGDVFLGHSVVVIFVIRTCTDLRCHVAAYTRINNQCLIED